MSNKHQGIISERAGVTLNVGHGNFILAERIVAILESGSLPIKRLCTTASNQNRLLDATAGRRTRSIIITDSEHVVLSALGPQALQERLRESRLWMTPAQVELAEGEFVS